MVLWILEVGAMIKRIWKVCLLVCLLGFFLPGSGFASVVKVPRSAMTKVSLSNSSSRFYAAPRSELSPTAYQLVWMVSDCLKMLVFFIAVYGGFNGISDESDEGWFENSKQSLLSWMNRPAKNRLVHTKALDARWNTRVSKAYHAWLALLQSDDTTSKPRWLHENLVRKAHVMIQLNSKYKQQLIISDLDLRQCCLLEESSRHKTVKVEAFMRRYVVDVDGLIVSGSKDIVRVREILQWSRQGAKSNWCLVNISAC
tara:strand:+ start:2114 stop:2881 length:768 start_codon:yes stop_codon:yes gene_type:complete